MPTAAIPRVRKQRTAHASWLWAVWVLPCIGVAGYAIVRYLVIPPSQGHFAERLFLLQIHAGAGAVALLTGPWQFWTWLRNVHRDCHRWAGRIFLLAVAASSLAGFALSFHSQEGWATHSGFLSLAVVWFWTAYMAYGTARTGRFQIHREWVTRCFALALAAVMLRIELPLLLFLAHASFHAAYITVAWSSWIPNLIAAEWWLARRRRKAGNVPAPAEI